MSEMLLFGGGLGSDRRKQYQDDLLATLIETPSSYDLMSISQRARSCSAFVFFVYS